LRENSPLRADFSKWRTDRQISGKIRDRWAEVAARAVPLYDGNDSPTLVEFSDYECPFCRAQHPIVDSAVAMGARVAIIHVPIASHKNAYRAAVAAVCAKSGSEFRVIHNHLLSTDAWMRDTSIAALFGRDSASASEREACSRDRTATATVDAHLEMALSLGIRGTPTYATRVGLIRAKSTDELRNELRKLSGARPD
ncbi:MAG: thioredoxin domain-containing protein, partial [Gemmatimonadaceae bacterium]|nr:thioredoxin domain-containing protein [Gemmatimonadaceae bacterium]